MIVFLEKVRVKTQFSLFEPIVTEPLELMYVATVLKQEGIDVHIIDDLFDKHVPKEIIPDLVILNGYNVAENKMIQRAKWYKTKYPESKIMASGVHVQMNRARFRVPGFDYVFFSQSLETFRRFVKGDKVSRGLDYYNEEMKQWVLGEADYLIAAESVEPDRSFFYEMEDRTRYLDKKSVALVKGGYGCPYRCSFCYCRLLNNGVYIEPDYKSLFEEIHSTQAEHFWVVDDSFLVTGNQASAFIDAAKHFKERKSLIAYLRADFLVDQSDLVTDLKTCGLDEVIIGFESPDGGKLRAYNKGQTADIYKRAVEIAHGSGISVTGLFIVDPDFGVREFYRLYRYIKWLDLSEYTLSIMTPLPGTDDFQKQIESLTTDNPEYFDFLHLVVPSRLPKVVFYTLFYLGHLRLLKSARIRRMIRGR